VRPWVPLRTLAGSTWVPGSSDVGSKKICWLIDAACIDAACFVRFATLVQAQI
jgi:hypothetical protein